MAADYKHPARAWVGSACRAAGRGGCQACAVVSDAISGAAPPKRSPVGSTKAVVRTPCVNVKVKLAASTRSLAARAAAKSSRPTGRSEEHTSELQSLMRISYAVFCLKKKKKKNRTTDQLNT